jgi:sarcosine oxidase subunit alpha
MRELFEVRVNGQPMLVDAATTVAAAILQSGVYAFRTPVSGTPRGPLCGMGICAECRATVNGIAGEFTCQRLCEPGMRIETESLSNMEER